MARKPFEIGGTAVPAGARREIGVTIARLVTGTELTLPLVVLHGKSDGPTVWLDAAIHGDEVCGIEIIRRVLADLKPASISGTLIAIPIVNVHGFMSGDRYLPDRRDLNRSFPGSARGSLGSQLAHLLMQEVVTRCDVGIDLHSGSDNRSNLPHIRADLDDRPTRELAEAFGAPVMVNAKTRDGSLRHAASEVGARVLLFEGGESWRFDESTVAVGVAGVRRVLSAIGLAPVVGSTPPASLLSRSTRWARASRTGILHLEVELGALVHAGQQLGAIYDSFGHRHSVVRAPVAGVLIGRTQAPYVTRGDAVTHIAQIEGGQSDDG